MKNIKLPPIPPRQRQVFNVRGKTKEEIMNIKGIFNTLPSEEIKQVEIIYTSSDNNNKKSSIMITTNHRVLIVEDL